MLPEKLQHMTELENYGVIFVVDLSSYYKIDSETGKSLLHKYRTHFKSFLKSKWADSFTIFFNKLDVFIESLSVYPLVNYFPEYQGSK